MLEKRQSKKPTQVKKRTSDMPPQVKKRGGAHTSARIRARKVLETLSDNPRMGIGSAMIMAGYAPLTAANPQNLTNSKTFMEMLDEYLPESEILMTHKELLRAAHLDHETFPLGPHDEDGRVKFIAYQKEQAAKNGREYQEVEVLTDDDIRALMAEKNCTVRKVVHGEQARHVYFWSPDNRARKDALEMGYKLRGSFAPEKHLHVGFSLKDLGASRSEAPALPPPDASEPPALPVAE